MFPVFIQISSKTTFPSTFEFEQLFSELGSCQLMDALRHGVLVVQRFVAGVGDGGAVQQGDVTGAGGEGKCNVLT